VTYPFLPFALEGDELPFPESPLDLSPEFPESEPPFDPPLAFSVDDPELESLWGFALYLRGSVDAGGGLGDLDFAGRWA
jgi:hypothetical protein